VNARAVPLSEAEGAGAALERALILVTCTAVTFLYAMTVTIANVSLPQMQGALSASPDQIAWVVTANIVATAVMTPLAGWLTSRFGRRLLCNACVLGFGIASLGCGLSDSLTELVIFRVLQGAIGAPLVPLSQAIVLDTYAKRHHGVAIALFGVGSVLGPVVGPVAGGWLAETYNWRWVFYMIVPFALVTLVGTLAFIHDRDAGRKLRLDWLGFLLLSTLLFTRHAHDIPIYFIAPYQMFPIWPSANLKLILTLFGLTGVLLLAPKVMSLLVILLRRRAWCYGGGGRLLASALIEFLHSLLLAPVRMLFHTQFFIAALTGWKLEWKSPPRGDAATTWGEAARRHGVHTLLALVWVGAIHASGAPFPVWLSPIILGLLAGIPLSVWGSRVGAGRSLEQAGLLLIPEEIEPPLVLTEARRHAELFAERGAGFVEAVVDPQVQRSAVAANVGRPAPTGSKAAARAERIARALARGPESIEREWQLRLLGDTAALGDMRDRIERREAHASWLQAKGRPPMVPAASHEGFGEALHPPLSS